MPPKLTIVIPTINRCHLLKRALQSALAQTADDIEILVSNNGSTDETRAVLAEFDDPRLRILHRDTTIDACSHGNYLLAQAQGELFLGLSDDDYIEPNFASDIIAFFATHPEVSFAYTGCNIHYAEIIVPAKIGPEIETGTEFLCSFMAGLRDVCWCACVTRTADLRSIGDIPPQTICGDMFYWTKLAAQGSVGCVRKMLSHYIAYRNDGDNSSTGSPVIAWATEVSKLTKSMVESCTGAAANHPANVNHLKQLGQEFLARSTADQFVWNALRGSRRLSLLTSLPPALTYLSGGSLGIWIRIVAAISLPRNLVRARVLAAARRKAESIRSNQALSY